MAVIYLKHEIHGIKVASTTSEASSDKSQGWIEISEEDLRPKKEEPVKTVEKESVEEQTSTEVEEKPNWLVKTEEPAVQYKRRPGRKRQ